ncbi:MULTISPECIES: DUF2635 domain-containing protein [Cronobacter]|uniref:DUF2635 domain-containing protein n=1 Tax=Cronobacter TaxID=413496 RepID=UPI0022E042B8|nr:MULTISPECIES: DUF2635 domain-containing protein [Cronobacter]ELY4024986.1 DUF2635 domain-containing protein [Cronobacter malonaticus]ELQ6225031.1 DUF2635 domain-containing protein [Cronobacter turicensis]ELY5850930.1 DUF2635 domain-containing protein [Cronobacter turicensis]MDK1335883.1 DUF2635 domain-containing protein [Cronobacter turicensis]HDI3034338.1 DUF2635 domain-containing protein [Cronobacter turicensis]
MFVIPVKGRKVPDPLRGDVLPEKGRNVEKNSYWLRRLKGGDVKETSQKKGD